MTMSRINRRIMLLWIAWGFLLLCIMNESHGRLKADKHLGEDINSKFQYLKQNDAEIIKSQISRNEIMPSAFVGRK